MNSGYFAASFPSTWPGSAQSVVVSNLFRDLLGFHRASWHPRYGASWWKGHSGKYFCMCKNLPHKLTVVCISSMLPFARGWQFTVFLGTFNKKSLTEDNMQHLNLGFEEMMRQWTFDSESHGSKPFNYRMAWYKRVLWYLLTSFQQQKWFSAVLVLKQLWPKTQTVALLQPPLPGDVHSVFECLWSLTFGERKCRGTTCFDRFQSSFSGIQC